MPENTEHPTQKPEKLIAKLILASSKENDVVFDPFLGSGTSFVVAKKLNRQYVGIEMNEECCCLCEKRLENAEMNGRVQGYEAGVFWEMNTGKVEENLFLSDHCLADILYICRLVFNDYKKFMIVLSNNNENKAMETIQYNNEKELQEILFHNPILLQNEDEDVTLYPIQREINLSESGKLDILCIDSNAKITAVEVKLASNSQARREVVGQIFDYISYLYGLSFHELNSISNNRLQLIINNNDFNIEKDFIEKEIDTNLRNAGIRLIIAVDNINDNLNRIIDFISVIAKIDVRLIVISKFKTTEDKELFVSNTIIKSFDIAEKRGVYNKTSPKFEESIVLFNQKNQNGYKAVGRATNWRAIWIPEWPKAIHYEFSYLDKDIDNIFIDLHIEDKNWHALYHDVVEQFIEKKVKDYEIIKRRNGTKSKWIGISVPYSAGNEKITQCMDELIKLTKDSITNYIQQNN